MRRGKRKEENSINVASVSTCHPNDCIPATVTTPTAAALSTFVLVLCVSHFPIVVELKLGLLANKLRGQNTFLPGPQKWKNKIKKMDGSEKRKKKRIICYTWGRNDTVGKWKKLIVEWK